MNLEYWEKHRREVLDKTGVDLSKEHDIGERET